MSSVPNPLVAAVRASSDPVTGSAAAQAQREVAALYTERAGEFLSYALTLGRNEELAHDAVQEAFMRYFVARCDGVEILSPRPWIYRVMHNYLVDAMRQSRCIQDFAMPLPAGAPDVEGACLRQEVFQLVRQALSPREFACFRLRTEGLGYEEIAERLDLKSGTVGALISRAMRKLGMLRRGAGVRS